MKLGDRYKKEMESDEFVCPHCSEEDTFKTIEDCESFNEGKGCRYKDFCKNYENAKKKKKKERNRKID